MTAIPHQAREAMERARRGDFEGAIRAGETAILEASDDFGLRIFLGLLHGRRGQLESAEAHLRHAVALDPDDALPRLELVRVLIGLNRVDEADALLRATAQQAAPTEQLRLRALIHRRRGEFEAAAALYRDAIAVNAQDFESLGNLGVCLLALGDAEKAADALTASLTLRRDQLAFRDKWADAEVAAGRGEEGLKLATDFASANPDDVMVRVTIARLEDLLGRPERALVALEEGLALDPANAPALLALASLLERENQLEALEQLVERTVSLGLPESQTALIRAKLYYRQGNFRAALDAARLAPDATDSGSRAQLIGTIQDRLNDPQGAFEAFVAMNAEAAREVRDPRGAAARFRRMIAERTRLVNRDWVRGWTRTKVAPKRAAPVFLVGFPRSGTTLLDTFLMGHPDTCVAEEMPMLQTVSEALGDYDRLATLKEKEIESLRSLYFSEADARLPDAKGRLLIDKLPLAIVHVPLIHRLFPDARFIFAQRHPCDVVLSCFMTRFHPVGGMANFLDLEDTARLYDVVLAMWQRCRAVFPLLTHLVRYERLIDDPEIELRPLVAFLGLQWDGRLLDSHGTALERQFIATPSYSQVAEPIYDRAIGRWNRYLPQLRPVLPLLKPWADQMDYGA
jgi:tetratricopeptide (TPR) repeat protein